MITLTVEGQQRARDALKRLDQAITTDQDAQEHVWQQARNFRDIFFEAFELMERESFSLNELFVKVQRIDANQFQITNKKHAPFLLILNSELAYSTRTVASEQGETQPRRVTKLAARIFAILEPPLQGLLRYYTIFGDGTWTRTSFVVGTDGALYAQNAMAPVASADVLMLEAIDLLGKVCTLHPTWADLTASADTMVAEKLRDRASIKMYLTGR
jgi:hypothetical protein